MDPTSSSGDAFADRWPMFRMDHPSSACRRTSGALLSTVSTWQRKQLTAADCPNASAVNVGGRQPLAQRACTSTRRLRGRALDVDDVEATPGVGVADAAVTDSSGECGGGNSGLQRLALLQLLGPSTHNSHATGLSLLAQAQASLGTLMGAAATDHEQQQLSYSLETLGEAGPAARRLQQQQQLPTSARMQVACLASVAASLVRLPQVMSEHGQQGASSGLMQHLLGGGTPAAVVASTVAAAAAAGPPAAAVTAAAAPTRAAAGAAATAGAAAAAAAAATACNNNKNSLSSSSTCNSSSGSSSGGSSGRAKKQRKGVASEDFAGSTEQGQQQQQKDEELAAARQPDMLANPVRYAKLLFSGAMSAVVSRTCVAPLERIKMDLLLKNGTGDAATTAAQVLHTEGVQGFWKGNALNVLRTAPFKAVNFFSFDMYHSALMRLSGRDGNSERFTAGACAGVTATLVCFPLDVVRTRLMASVAGPRYGAGPFSTLGGILRNEGAAALYSGCLPAVIGMAPAGAVFYGVYDMLKHKHLAALTAMAEAEAAEAHAAAAAAAGLAGLPRGALPPVVVQVSPAYTLMYGAMAGASSELIVYPLEVIRRKMQLQSMALAGLRQAGGAAAGGSGALGAAAASHHLGGGGAAAAANAAAAAAAAASGMAAGHQHTGAAAASAVGRLAAAAAQHHHHHHLGAGIGGVGGGVGSIPQQRLLALMSSAAVANSPGLARVAAAVAAIVRADGLRGFYSGLLPNMLQVLPSAALSYYTYDTLKTALGAR